MIDPVTIAAAAQLVNMISQAIDAANKGQTTPEQADALRAASEMKLALAKSALARAVQRKEPS